MEMHEVVEKQRDGWRNLAVALSSVVLLLVGAFIGDLNASLRFRGLSDSLKTHSDMPGHPVMVEKVGNIEGDLEDIEEHLEENGKTLAAIAGKVGVE